MRQVDHRIKKRRDERIRSLSQNRSPRQTSWPVAAQARPRNATARTEKRRSRLAVQMFLSALLFAFTYITFQADTMVARQTQGFITEVMERDYNFQGVAAWYEEHLGGIPAIIPTFSKNNEQMKGHDVDSRPWLPPVQGDVVEPYHAEDHPYVTLNGSKVGQVTASTEGLVSFVGEKEDWGHCVIVQHPDDTETWYGPLSAIQVERSDWVEAADPLGQVTAVKGTIQFGVKQGGTFIDPLDVITID